MDARTCKTCGTIFHTISHGRVLCNRCRRLPRQPGLDRKLPTPDEREMIAQTEPAKLTVLAYERIIDGWIRGEG